MAELAAADREIESGVRRILDAADGLMQLRSLAPPTIRAALDQRLTEILEACEFQDIVGQRLKKATRLLQRAESPAACPPDLAGDAAGLLNGPALLGPEVSQQAIDQLFD